MDADLIPTSWEKRGNIITVVGVGGGGNNAISPIQLHLQKKKHSTMLLIKPLKEF